MMSFERNLISNPFECDCRLRWLGKWLADSNLATGNPKCNYPDALKGKALSSLDPKLYEDCGQNSTLDGECGSDNMGDKIILKSSHTVCPANCTCTSTLVRCSRVNLKTFPEGIMSTVQELYLDSNEITEIPVYIKKLVNLEKLYK